MSDSWQQRRSSLNHDWLKNDFVKSVDAFVSRLEQDRPDTKRLAEFLSVDLPNWESRREALRSLVGDAESALSPRRLFDVPPLLLCPAATMKWLPALVHAFWLARYPVRQWADDAHRAMDMADAAYDCIAHLAGDAATGLDMFQLLKERAAFREFAEALRILTKAISRWPHRALVT